MSTSPNLQVEADGLRLESERLREMVARRDARIELLEWAVGTLRAQLVIADEAFAQLLEHKPPEWAT